jgi:cytoskeletal protein CcmA (bactofilin family)
MRISQFVKQNAAIRGNLSGSSFFGAGLGDCNNATSSKLIYNPTTGKFSCATDQTGGSSGGLSYGVAKDIFVNQSGDTMTGALTMNMKTTHTETGALNIVQQTHATGAYIKSMTGKESALAIDIVGTPNAPHLLFGYQGIFDANLYRSSAFLLKTNSSFFAAGTLSGSKLRVSGSADIHGPLAVSGAIRADGDLTINDDRTTSADAVLIFGNSTTNQTLKYVHSLQKFEFSKDLRVVGSISGSAIRIDGTADIHGALNASGAVHFDSNVSINDDRSSGDAILTFGNATLNQDLKYIDANQRFQFSTNLNVMGSISGASLIVSGASAFSGAALFRARVTAKGGFSGATLYGAGLGDCSNATSSKQLFLKMYHLSIIITIVGQRISPLKIGEKHLNLIASKLFQKD